MSTLTVKLPKAIEGDLLADLEKQGVYVSPEIRKLKVRLDGTMLDCEIAEGADAAAVEAKLGRFITTMIARFRKLPHQVVANFERSDRGELETNVFEELKRRKWLVEVGRGQVSLRGPALAVLREIDKEATALGIQEFGAHEVVFPTLIPTATLVRCGYLASFPQNASLVTHLVEDYDLIDEFRQANVGANELVVPRASALVKPESCLSPAVCYQHYPLLEGARLDDTLVVTAVGKCFRYESSNIVGLDRLWDFTMREVIFVGTQDEVMSRRQRGLELIRGQLARWDLEGRIETANDPFFSATYAAKTYHQLQGGLKFELRLTIEPQDGARRDLACASFNLHENYFGHAFTITASDGQPAFTGCLAWGLERWVLACFAQHGFDESRWPAAVRDLVFRSA